ASMKDANMTLPPQEIGLPQTQYKPKEKVQSLRAKILNHIEKDKIISKIKIPATMVRNIVPTLDLSNEHQVIYKLRKNLYSKNISYIVIGLLMQRSHCAKDAERYNATYILNELILSYASGT